MAIAGLPHSDIKARSRLRRSGRRKWLIGAGIVVAGLAIAGFLLARQNWPFRYEKIKPVLEDVFGSQIAIASYHRTYFPNPGFVAQGLTLRRKSALDQPAIGTVKQLVVQGHWIDFLLLRDRLQLFQMDGVHIVLPPPGSPASSEDFPPGSANAFTGPETEIQRLEIRNSVLEVQRRRRGALVFPVAELHIEHMHKGQPMTFAVEMGNAIPSGHIRASGRFGPLNAANVGATPLSGDFRFTSVRLHDVGNIHGTLSSYGRFQGQLDALEAEATTNTPDFSVDDGKPAPVDGRIECRVDGLKGNVFYRRLELRTGQTLIQAWGQTAGSPNATKLDITVRKGRAEDLLRPFLHRDVPITGPVSLHSHAYLAPAQEGVGFFERLQVDGAFDIPTERVTNPSTEARLTEFSERAQGKNPKEPDEDSRDAISTLVGPASVRNAIVTTRGLQFTVAGAQARLDGTFNLHTSEVHLTGNLAMQSDISHTASGLKSFLLKPLAPFFHKKNAGAVVPIAVVGTPGKYRVMQNLNHTK